VINAWGMHDSEPFSGTVYLEANRFYDLQVDYFNGLLEGEIQLYWQLPSQKPVFGGAFGYNDKVIDSKFFYQPTSMQLPAPNQNIAHNPKTNNPPPVNTSKPKPVANKPTAPKPAPAKPVVHTFAQASDVPADTLEKYLPKNILFVQSKSIMLAQSEPELDRLSGFLVRNPALRLSVEGHTDNHGDSAKNLILSKERARVVADYLASKGVAAERIKSEGYGDTRPLQTIASGNVKNRRVEFKIY